MSSDVERSTGLSSEELLGFLRRLRAVREYTSEPVDQQTIEAILEVGRWSGSASNRQLTELIVIRDPAVKEQLGEWGAKPAATAAVVLLLVAQANSWPLDEGRLLERLLLAAAAFGLGSTVASLKGEGPEAVKPLLGIPADRRCDMLAAIGHTDVAARRALPRRPQPRKPLAEFVHWERF